jgi:hypothetical protein
MIAGGAESFCKVRAFYGIAAYAGLMFVRPAVFFSAPFFAVASFA